MVQSMIPFAIAKLALIGIPTKVNVFTTALEFPIQTQQMLMTTLVIAILVTSGTVQLELVL